LEDRFSEIIPQKLAHHKLINDHDGKTSNDVVIEDEIMKTGMDSRLFL
jgi:hypothetical protein